MIKIAMLGLGTVGSSVIKLIKYSIDPKIATITDILVKDINKKRDLDLTNISLTTDPDKILKDKSIDIIIEVIGGDEPALEYILTAIKNGKSVITSNKNVLALHGDKILELVKKNKIPIAFEASVGGGIPIIRTLITSFNANKISRFMGICNGTTNYLLSSMLLNKNSFEKSLEEAQKLGIAESDPSFDIDGYDSAYKCSIISALAFKLDPSYIFNKKSFDKIDREGIKNILYIDMKHAEKLGYIIKPIVYGVINYNNNLILATFPALINKQNLISQINGVDNIIQLDSDILGVSNYTGPGAGGDATASSVLADLWNIIENKKLDLDFYTSLNKKYELISIKQECFDYFISINLLDNSYKFLTKNELLLNIINLIESHGVKVLKSFYSEDGYIIFLTNAILGSVMDKVAKDLKSYQYINNCKYIRVID